MADRYIDIFEVSEYGDFFLSESKRLVGASSLVNVEVLQERVRVSKEKVETERAKAGTIRKQADSAAALEATENLRGHLGRFHSFLNSLDPSEVKVDVTKFFPGNVLDGLRQLKPADVKARAEKVSEGFAVEAHKDTAELAPWSKKLSAAKEALAALLANKDGQKNEGILLTASVAAAREEFLTAYNTVAKPLLRGLLSSLGRSEEFERYFKDLQVNENRKAKPEESPTEPTTPEA